MSDKRTRSVSLEADDVYIQALGALAKKYKKTIGKLIREAADARFGEELKPIVSFFTASGNQINHSKDGNTNGSGAA